MLAISCKVVTTTSVKITSLGYMKTYQPKLHPALITGYTVCMYVYCTYMVHKCVYSVNHRQKSNPIFCQLKHLMECSVALIQQRDSIEQ